MLESNTWLIKSYQVTLISEAKSIRMCVLSLGFMFTQCVCFATLALYVVLGLIICPFYFKTRVAANVKKGSVHSGEKRRHLYSSMRVTKKPT